MTYGSITHGGHEVMAKTLHFIGCLVSLIQVIWLGNDRAYWIHTHHL